VLRIKLQVAWLVINLIIAVEYTNEQQGITVGLTGFDGGKLKQICAQGIHVPCNKGEYGPAEDAHMIIDHLVHAYISSVVRSELNVEV
jgi:D-sedoheptulose 7-phosphate isomerase